MATGCGENACDARSDAAGQRFRRRARADATAKDRLYLTIASLPDDTMNARLPIAAPTDDPADTAVRRMHEAFDAQRAAFAADMLPPREARVDRLERILRLTTKYQREIADAISKDFGHRARAETDLAEIFLVLSAVRQARRHVGRWMKPRRVATPVQMLPARSEIVPQPLGVVGVISPWNYPYQLAMLPAAEAIAAGNRVMVKPSELVPSFSQLLHDIVAEFFSPEELTVIVGDVAVGRAFAKLAFDHLFFTGSTSIGRQVALAAAENLTPVTLELGGKSPAIIDADCDIALVAPRIAHAKLLNAGQTCVAPDYMLVPRARVGEFVAAFSAAAARMYPTIGLGFRYGRSPEIFSVASPTAGLMFTNDTMPIKARFFFATGPIDWKGLYKANVA